MLTFAVALVALAQPQGSQPYPQAGPASPGFEAPAVTGAGQGRGGGWGAMRERRQARLAELRAALSLRPDQEPAFGDFLQALRPDPALMAQRQAERARIAAMTEPERAQARLAQAPEREAMMRRRLEATRRFYAALSPDQQRAFDAYMRERTAGRREGAWRRDGAERPAD